MVNLINPSKGYPYNARYKPFQQKDLDFLIENKNRYTITEMAHKLGFASKTIFKYANHFGIKSTVRKHKKKKPLDKVKIAKVVEHFANTFNIKEAGDVAGISIGTASNMVSAHWMFKKESDSTEVITLKSKV